MQPITLRDEYQVILSPEYDEETVEIAWSKIVLWSLYVGHDLFLGQSFSHPLEGKVRLGASRTCRWLNSLYIYFAPLLFVYRSSCDTGEAGKEPLRKGVDGGSGNAFGNQSAATA